MILNKNNFTGFTKITNILNCETNSQSVIDGKFFLPNNIKSSLEKISIEIYKCTFETFNFKILDRKISTLQKKLKYINDYIDGSCRPDDAMQYRMLFASEIIDTLIVIALSKNNEKFEQVTTVAGLSLIIEVITYPSPGLVNLFNCGPHHDMDCFSFFKSINVILPHLREAAVEIRNAEDNGNDNELFQLLRGIGIRAEIEMYKATGGVNTYKGAIFLMLLLIAAATISFKHHRRITAAQIGKIISRISNPVISEELNREQYTTVGQRAWRDFGLSGIRGEVMNGIPHVIQWGLPTIRYFYNKGYSLNSAASQALLTIQSQLYDTTLLNRGYDMKRISYAKATAGQAILMGGVTNQNGIRFVTKMEELFEMRNLNPGGAADLLAISIAVFLFEKLM